MRISTGFASVGELWTATATLAGELFGAVLTAFGDGLPYYPPCGVDSSRTFSLSTQPHQKKRDSSHVD